MATDFAAWVSGLVEECVAPAPDAGAWLVALTGAGRVVVASGEDLGDLRRYPVDRLALVPSTYGGMIASATPRGVLRVVCADDEGAVAVLEGDAGGWVSGGALEAQVADHEVLALLWLLMDVRATRPSTFELAARVLVWAWLASSAREASGVRSGDAADAGVACLAAGDLGGLAHLVEMTLPDVLDAEGLRSLAVALGHPALDWDALPWVVTEEQRLDFLHACLPTRWALADELRTVDGRHDLAAIVMAAPAPSPWRDLAC